MIHKSLLLVSCTTVFLTFGPSAFAGDTAAAAAVKPADSLLDIVQPQADSTTSQAAADSSKAKIATPVDSTQAAITEDNNASTGQKTVDKALADSNLKLIKRTYNSKQQVILATGMMIFVVLIMTLAQQFNPG